LKDYHQACTRMARADYCGNGTSHTVEGNLIDMYDNLGIRTRSVTAERGVDPSLLSFEAAWGPDGAYCLDHVRKRRPEDKIITVEDIRSECKGTFARGAREDLGQGDGCEVRRGQRSGNA